MCWREKRLHHTHEPVRSVTGHLIAWEMLTRPREHGRTWMLLLPRHQLLLASGVCLALRGLELVATTEMPACWRENSLIYFTPWDRIDRATSSSAAKKQAQTSLPAMGMMALLKLKQCSARPNHAEATMAILSLSFVAPSTLSRATPASHSTPCSSNMSDFPRRSQP